MLNTLLGRQDIEREERNASKSSIKDSARVCVCVAHAPIRQRCVSRCSLFETQQLLQVSCSGEGALSFGLLRASGTSEPTLTTGYRHCAEADRNLWRGLPERTACRQL